MLASEIVNPYLTLLYLWGLALLNSLLTSCGLLLGSPKTLCRLSPQRSHSIEL